MRVLGFHGGNVFTGYRNEKSLALLILCYRTLHNTNSLGLTQRHRAPALCSKGSQRSQIY